MKDELLYIKIAPFYTESNVYFKEIQLSYQLFGKKLGTAPVVLVNHALTGNSNVSGNSGWWSKIIGDDKIISTKKYTVLAFNIPGNGYDGFMIDNYKSLIARDIAKLFLEGIKQLGIQQLFALIGGSLGGGIAWEMFALNHKITKHLIPVATDWKSTDWLIANCLVQEQLLLNSKEPIHDARIHAMLCYRTPASFQVRFHRSKNEDLNVFNIESWLLHHGKKLQERFQLASYKLMNHLLRTIDIASTNNFDVHEFSKTKAHIHLITVDSDLFFTAKENKDIFQVLSELNVSVNYNEIQSIHGHDAFLIEYEQLASILSPIFEGKRENRNNLTITKAVV